MEKGSPEKLIDHLLREAREKDQKGKTSSLTQTPSTQARDRYDLIPPIIRKMPLLNNFKIEKTFLKNNYEIKEKKILL